MILRMASSHWTGSWRIYVLKIFPHSQVSFVSEGKVKTIYHLSSPWTILSLKGKRWIKQRSRHKLFRRELCLIHTVVMIYFYSRYIGLVLMQFSCSIFFLVEVCLVDWLVYLFLSIYECFIQAKNFLYFALYSEFCSPSLWFNEEQLLNKHENDDCLLLVFNAIIEKFNKHFYRSSKFPVSTHPLRQDW